VRPLSIWAGRHQPRPSLAGGPAWTVHKVEGKKEELVTKANVVKDNGVTCVCCKKPLRKDTRRMTVSKGTVPEVYKNDRDWAAWNGRKVLKVTSRRSAYRADERENFDHVDCWMGDYSGYGSAANRLAPLFCTLRCSLSFAQKAYVEGFEVSR